MAGSREPRSFLYDDYHMEDDSYGRREVYPESRNDYGIGSSNVRGNGLRRREFNDVGLDELAAHLPRAGARHRDLDAFGGGSSTGHARRFADAMGIQSNRSQRVYDDLEYEAAAPRPRMAFRDAPAPRVRQVVRRVGGGPRGYYDDSREVVEVIQRVARPQRRIQVVRKVPIHQRVVKKVIVQKSFRSGGNNRRGNNNRVSALASRVKRGANIGGVQKKKLGGARPTRPKKDSKPKLSASELDRELDAYMKGGKHKRVEI